MKRVRHNRHTFSYGVYIATFLVCQANFNFFTVYMHRIYTVATSLQIALPIVNTGLKYLTIIIVTA